MTAAPASASASRPTRTGGSRPARDGPAARFPPRPTPRDRRGLRWPDRGDHAGAGRPQRRGVRRGVAGLGASSRSGGMIGHGHRLSYTKLTERFGTGRAQALIREGMAQLEHLVELVAAEKIDAKLQRVGRFRGAATPPTTRPWPGRRRRWRAISACPWRWCRAPSSAGRSRAGSTMAACCSTPMAACIRRCCTRGLLDAARRAGAIVAPSRPCRPCARTRAASR